jgi:hypothetical protein
VVASIDLLGEALGFGEYPTVGRFSV